MSEKSETRTEAYGRVRREAAMPHPTSNGDGPADAKDGVTRIKMVDDEPPPDDKSDDKSLDWTSEPAHTAAVFGQRNHEALVKVNQLLAFGTIELGKTQALAMQVQSEQAFTGWKELLATKSFREALERHPRLAADAFVVALNERAKLALAAIDLVAQAMTPIAERLTSAQEEFLRHP